MDDSLLFGVFGIWKSLSRSSEVGEDKACGSGSFSLYMGLGFSAGAIGICCGSGAGGVGGRGSGPSANSFL